MTAIPADWKLPNDLVSSKEEAVVQPRPLGHLQGSRDTITYTSTSVFYLFNSTVIQKRIAPVTATSVLVCLPQGYVAC